YGQVVGFAYVTTQAIERKFVELGFFEASLFRFGQVVGRRSGIPVERRENLPIADSDGFLRIAGRAVEMPVKRCRAAHGSARQHGKEARTIEHSIARRFY